MRHKAVSVARFKKRNAEGLLEETTTVVLSYEEEQTLPDFVYIGFKRIKTKIFIPNPIRCTNCQLLGHTANFCKTRQKCPRCTGDHDYLSCTLPKFDISTSAELPKFKCRNCDGSHSSAYRGCPAYHKARQATKLKFENTITYAEAIKYLNNKSNKEINHSEEEVTTFPLPVTNYSNDNEKAINSLDQNKENMRQIISDITGASESINQKQKRRLLPY